MFDPNGFEKYFRKLEDGIEDEVQVINGLHQKHCDAPRGGSRGHDIQHSDTQHNDTQHSDTQHNDTQHNDTRHNNE